MTRSHRLLLAAAVALAANGAHAARYLVAVRDSDAVSRLRDAGFGIHYQYRLTRAVCVTAPEGATAALSAVRGVELVERDALAAAVQELQPWGVSATGALSVQARGNGGRGIKVALLDTGVRSDHRDLTRAIAAGHDFVNGDAEPMDEHGHGTHCAGIIAARRDGRGVVGVAPQASLLIAKVMGADGKGWYSDIIAGLDWAVEHGAQVVSMSIGARRPSRIFERACQAAYRRGVVLVAASGNDGRREVMIPAQYSSVIAVGAIDKRGNAASFSNYGPELELTAPGTWITSTWRGGGYGTFWGTSMACPHVSGAVALLLATPPGDYDADGDGVWSPDEVRACLHAAARDLGPPGRDERYGYGVIDAYHAALGRDDVHRVVIRDVVVPSVIRRGREMKAGVTVENQGAYDEWVVVRLTEVGSGRPLLLQRGLLPRGARRTLQAVTSTRGVAAGRYGFLAEVEYQVDGQPRAGTPRTVMVTVR